MSTHLYLAPAAAGKTTYVLELARATARGLSADPRVVVASHLQMDAARHRLAEMGGAIGVRLLTFEHLYQELLNAAGEVFTALSEPVQYRLIRAMLDVPLPALEEAPGARKAHPLEHYAPLIDRPGFVQVLQRLIGELKAAGVHPDDFAHAVRVMGGEPRLLELAEIYAAYQSHLQTNRWADRAGLGWLAVETLRERAPDAAPDWPVLAVDGFDSFTPVQLALLDALAGRVGNLVITLTGDPAVSERSLAHRRFARTQIDLEQALGLQAEPLPDLTGLGKPVSSDPLVHMERTLFRPGSIRVEAAGAIDLIEAPDRSVEVRAALRWLKARILMDGCRPGEVALLARDLTTYRPFVQQTAAEFGMPIRLVAGLPLREDPAVAALLSLLRNMLPAAGGEPALLRRPVVEAWRSPYFDWSALPYNGATEPIGIQPGDADDLDAVARWGRVIGGLSQWAEAFEGLAGLTGEAVEDEDRGLPPGLPRGAAARTLEARFERFVQRLTPPDGAHSTREFSGWLEDLIGEDTQSDGDPFSLGVVACTRAAEDPAVAARDVSALAAFKDALRGLVWAEEALHTPPGDFSRFVAELTGAVDAASHNLPVQPGSEEVLVADVIQARGLPFRAVAVIGLAEGEFPATLWEDPFLRDADRQRLRDEFGLPLELSTAGAEAGFFYETVTRPSQRLLLTRPRLADNGAPWQASPYWEEVRRLVTLEPIHLTSESAPQPGEVASWPELLESLASQDGYASVRTWAQSTDPARMAGLVAAAQGLRGRRPGTGSNPFDGDLGELAPDFAARFAPELTWSASRLEKYCSCPFQFFVAYVLGLEPREEPTEGLDARQLGNIYHHIFERLLGVAQDPASLDALLAALPVVARAVLDDAPSAEGFRATAWWDQTRGEIEGNVERSLLALAELGGSFAPIAQEAAFGGATALVVTEGDDSFRLRGLIDRVDRALDGGLRIIDYKTAGPSSFTDKAAVEGTKLQLPLYALAAEQALQLGQVVDGFYWHVRHAESSKLTLGGFPGGVAGAVEVALAHAWSAVRGAREGRFAPRPPNDGCPTYCPAAGFCWHFRPRFGG